MDNIVKSFGQVFGTGLSGRRNSSRFKSFIYVRNLIILEDYLALYLLVLNHWDLVNYSAMGFYLSL